MEVCVVKLTAFLNFQVLGYTQVTSVRTQLRALQSFSGQGSLNQEYQLLLNHNINSSMSCPLKIIKNTAIHVSKWHAFLRTNYSVTDTHAWHHLKQNHVVRSDDTIKKVVDGVKGVWW